MTVTTLPGNPVAVPYQQMPPSARSSHEYGTAPALEPGVPYGVVASPAEQPPCPRFAVRKVLNAFEVGDRVLEINTKSRMLVNQDRSGKILKAFALSAVSFLRPQGPCTLEIGFTVDQRPYVVTFPNEQQRRDFMCIVDRIKMDTAGARAGPPPFNPEVSLHSFVDQPVPRGAAETRPREGSSLGINEDGSPKPGFFHVVLPEDTLAGLALRYGCSQGDIRRANRLPGSLSGGGNGSQPLSSLTHEPEIWIPVNGVARPVDPEKLREMEERRKVKEVRATCNWLDDLEARAYLEINDWNVSQCTTNAQDDLHWEQNNTAAPRSSMVNLAPTGYEL